MHKKYMHNQPYVNNQAMNSVQLIFKPRLPLYLIETVIAILLLGKPAICSEEANIAASANKPEHKNHQPENDSIKIEKLAEKAFYFNNYLGNKHLADSMGQKAIDYAEATFRPGLMLLAYIRYIESMDPGMYMPKSMRYAEEAVKLSKTVSNTGLGWRSLRNLAKVNIETYNYDKALATSYQALSLADALQNEELKAESYLLIGQSLEGNNQKIEAFRNYLNTSSLAEKLQKQALIKKSYSLLSGFYNRNKMYDKAIEYKLKQVDEIIKSHPVDSTELMWAYYDLQAINVYSNNNRVNTQSIEDVLEFAFRTNNFRLKNYEIALYRSHLIEANKISQLKDLYNYRYPDELSKLSDENPSLFFRLKAFFCEEEKKYDSAYYFLEKAEHKIQSDPNKILQSNFYQRYGQFLIRQNKPKEAIAKYLISFELAREASYFEYMLSTSKQLESLYAGMADYRNAYTYSELNKTLNDSLSMITKNDQLLMLEIDHETKKLELVAELEHIETHRRHNIQYMAITIIIIAMFILLIMLGSLKIPTWVIKVLGFFSFILFFEFIIMIADHKIYEITHNEPWKILFIKIGLIAFLLPFHHWIEKKVIHYLINNKLLKIPQFSLRSVLKKQPKKATIPVEDEN